MAQNAESANQTAEDLKRVEFRFCRECSNMLYPSEDRNQGTLTFACRHCAYMEEVGSTCIYRNNLSTFTGEEQGTIEDVTTDPTLPHVAKACERCGARDAVYFQSQQRSAETGMRLFYVCCECSHVWMSGSG